MTSFVLIVGLSLLTWLSFASTAAAHSGGLDSAGCHAGSQPYHCHNGGSGGGGGGDSVDTGSDVSTPLAPDTTQEKGALDQAKAELADAKQDAKPVQERYNSLTWQRDLAANRADDLEAKREKVLNSAATIRDQAIAERLGAASRIQGANRDYRVASDRARTWAGRGAFWSVLGIVLAILLVLMNPSGALIGRLMRWSDGATIIGLLLLAIGIALAVGAGSVGGLVLSVLLSGVGGAFVALAIAAFRIVLPFDLLPTSAASILIFALLAFGGLATMFVVAGLSESTPKPVHDTEDLELAAEAREDPDGEDAVGVPARLNEAEKLEAQIAKAEALEATYAKAIARIEPQWSKANARVKASKSEVANAQSELEDAKYGF